MSGAGRCYDNARMESFFVTLKKEKFYQMDTTSMSREEVKSVVFRYICYYNLRRISSVTGGLPPVALQEAILPFTPYCCGVTASFSQDPYTSGRNFS